MTFTISNLGFAAFNINFLSIKELLSKKNYAVYKKKCRSILSYAFSYLIAGSCEVIHTMIFIDTMSRTSYEHPICAQCIWFLPPEINLILNYCFEGSWQLANILDSYFWINLLWKRARKLLMNRKHHEVCRYFESVIFDKLYWQPRGGK